MKKYRVVLGYEVADLLFFNGSDIYTLSNHMYNYRFE